MKLNLPLYSYQLRSLPASGARLVNCFAELLPAGAATPVIIKRAPGIKTWRKLGSNIPVRGLYAAKFTTVFGDRVNRVYTVLGNDGRYFDITGSNSSVGTIPGTGRVSMTSNESGLLIVAEPRAFWYDGTFVEIVDDDFVSRGSAQVEFLDGFFIHREPNSNRFFISDIGDPLSYDALQVVKCDDHPDELVGIIAYQGQLMCFGEKTLEMYENTGAAGVPFTRIINGTIEVGCANADTIVRCYDQIFWVADDYTVRRLDGILPSRISTHAIEKSLADDTGPTMLAITSQDPLTNDMSAFSYEQEGHSFYCLTTRGGTYVYDVTTGEWAERESYGKTGWKARFHTQFVNTLGGAELVGDYESQEIGELDFETFTDWTAGTTQRMEWTYQSVYADGQRAFHDRLEIVLETGVGNTVTPGEDPKIMLEKSDDGGLTWQRLPDKTFGKRGERLSRAVWHNLGSARQRVYRAAVSDPVPVTVTDTIIEVRGGRL